MHIKNRWIYASALLGAVLLGTPGFAASSEAPSPANSRTPIATVNGNPIPESALLSMLLRDPSVVNPILDQLINDALIQEEAKRQHAEAASDEIQGRKEQLMTLNRVSNLDNLLRRHHETMADLERDIQVWIETVKLLTPDAKPPHMVRLRHILIRVTADGQTVSKPFVSHTDVEALAIIKTIQARIKDGRKFNELAKEYSEDPATRDSGGSLGIAYKDAHFEPAVLAAALTLTWPGEMLPCAVRSPLGYHLIQAESTENNHPRSENPAYANIAIEIRARSVTDARMQDFIRGLRTKAVVVNHYLSK